jgi:hypothetical protein
MLARFPDFVGGFGVPLSGNCTSTEPFMIIRQLNLGNVIYRWESHPAGTLLNYTESPSSSCSSSPVPYRPSRRPLAWRRLDA